MKKTSEQYTDSQKVMALLMAIEELEELYGGAIDSGYSQDWIDQIGENMAILLAMKEELDV